MRIRRGALQGEALSPLLFDLMVKPLFCWLTASGKGYEIPSCDLKLASKWYADDGTLVTNSVEDMISLLGGDFVRQNPAFFRLIPYTPVPPNRLRCLRIPPADCIDL